MATAQLLASAPGVTLLGEISCKKQSILWEKRLRFIGVNSLSNVTKLTGIEKEISRVLEDY